MEGIFFKRLWTRLILNRITIHLCYNIFPKTRIHTYILCIKQKHVKIKLYLILC